MAVASPTSAAFAASDGGLLLSDLTTLSDAPEASEGAAPADDVAPGFKLELGLEQAVVARDGHAPTSVTLSRREEPHMHMRMHMHACTQVHMRTCTHAHITHSHARTHACARAHTHTHMHKYRCRYLLTSPCGPRRHICIYTHAHAHMHRYPRPMTLMIR